jgi:ribosomal 50S subunit-associated protein YjgA (DUF615 family)
LERAESRLNKRIEPEVARLIRARDTDGIQCYIDALPRKYKAVRRLYEALERMNPNLSRDRDLYRPLSGRTS